MSISLHMTLKKCAYTNVHTFVYMLFELFMLCTSSFKEDRSFEDNFYENLYWMKHYKLNNVNLKFSLSIVSVPITYSRLRL